VVEITVEPQSANFNSGCATFKFCISRHVFLVSLGLSFLVCKNGAVMLTLKDGVDEMRKGVGEASGTW
jgi:hypothetical protein